ncbi:hypothetical protein [Segnochrobactrum spirostomi]|uniref:Trypsin-like peptidase domain-containing protein n=1 Tax=Segnochrobactrum spirostomi TaxID=2608987 RepID=A0A6A7Y2U1_9HYPH|nr:hypothetical protein [Segnochrobactrum spirostomi]MQT13025.1 hypothetical protein [Segnochrobactrum spirostomi]
MNDLERALRESVLSSHIADSKAAIGINVNGSAIPLNILISKIHAFGHCLTYYTGDPVYEIQLIGSATGISYQKNQFIIATKHQIKGFPPSDVGIVLPEGQVHVSSSGYTMFSDNLHPSGSDACDLISFDFNVQSSIYSGLLNRFFQLNQKNSLDDEENVLLYIVYGCAFVDQNYDVCDGRRVDTVIRSMICQPSANVSDIALGTCRTRAPMNFDPNGLSGGPVFAAVLDDGGVALKFAGVVNRAGNGIIHFIRSRFIINLLKTSQI